MSLNQFVYGEDNPVSLSDPDGMCSDPWTCPPPPGATKAVQNTWHKLQGKASTTIAQAYTWTSAQYWTHYHGSGPGVKYLMDIAAPPAPPIPIVTVQQPKASTPTFAGPGCDNYSGTVPHEIIGGVVGVSIRMANVSFAPGRDSTMVRVFISGEFSTFSPQHSGDWSLALKS
jgi:hypothetical protein